MKKSTLLTIIFSLLFTTSFYAQNDDVVAEDKIIVEKEPANLRFGLMGFSSIGWLSPENDLLLSRGKVGLGFGWGLNTEFFINKTTSFRTGVSLSTFKANLNYDDSKKNQTEYFTNTYFAADKAAFQKWENDTLSPTGDIRKLSSRKYKMSYINIPLILKLKTKEIGYLTYFGEFGGIIGIKTKAKVLDDYYEVNSFPDSINSTITKQVDFDFEDGAQLIRAGLCLGLGAEYNFSGSTSLFFQANWNYFMTNMLRKEEKDDYLRSYDSDSDTFERINSKSIPGSITITVGILF